MSEQELKVFLEKLEGDAAVKEYLKSTDDIDAVVEIAKASGFMLFYDDYRLTQLEISEKELESVGGGTIDFGALTLF